MSKIEEVAAAIADAAGSDFTNLPATQGPGHGLRNMYMNMARAAIEAMRNPAFDVDALSYHEGMSRRDWWEAMIDAALQEPTP